MKKTKRIILILLAAVLCFSFSACKKPVAEADYGGIHETNVEDLNYNFAENGSSAYQIVISARLDGKESFAASEIQDFLFEAAGVNIPIITDDEAQFSSEAKYISVGRNKLLIDSGIKFDDTRFQRSGYTIRNEGKSVFLAGSDFVNNNFGIVYAAYGFLEHLVGLKFYTANFYKLNKSQTVKMKYFDITEVPDFDWRRILVTSKSNKEQLRMRLCPDTEVPFAGNHTHLTYLPLADYAESHPEWYEDISKEKTQIRLANEELQLEFIENAKKILTIRPESTMLTFGLMDRNAPDNSPEAAAFQAKYGTNAAGMNIIFVNRVAKALDEWLETAFPGRKMTYRTLIYYEHFQAPVDYRKEKDREIFTPHHEAVIPRDNVLLFIAPIGMVDFSVPIDNNLNESLNLNIRKWGAISNNIFMWDYAMTHSSNFVNFNNFGSLKGNLKFALKNGVTGWYSEFAETALCELRTYVHSQLMWNSDLDYNDLAYEFINAYYGDAAPYMKEYFDFSVERCNVMRNELNAPQGIFSNISLARYWTLEIVTKMDGMMKNAELAIEPLKASDPDMHDEYLERIKAQKFTVLYLQLKNHFNFYKKSELLPMIDEFEQIALRNNFIYEATEGHILNSDVAKTWRETALAQ